MEKKVVHRRKEEIWEGGGYGGGEGDLPGLLVVGIQRGKGVSGD